MPITKYENHAAQNLIKLLSEKPQTPNPLNGIIHRLTMRARYNSHRHYEIYAIDCSADLDEEFWRKQWADYPQETAELIRDKGIQIFSNRLDRGQIKIT